MASISLPSLFCQAACLGFTLLSTVNAQPDYFLKSVPPAYRNISAVLIENNLAVIPGNWNVSDLNAPFYDIRTNDTDLSIALNETKNVDFIAFDPLFLDIIGPSAKLERILSFPGVSHVHEAPVYISETNELLFADTSVIGWLYAINAANYTVRNITTNPPLYNVNGGTYHRGKVYLCTNGSPVRAVYTFNWTDGTVSPVVNNYRGRKLNSPNDIVADENSNLWFTDPAYGWYTPWSGVEQPQLPNAVYFFNITSGALVPTTNDVVRVPNGLAFSRDRSTLYISDTNSTSGRPLQKSPSSVRNIWAFNVTGSILSNPRLVYQSEVGWPDGFRVTSNGYIIAGAASGADMFDPQSGVLLGKINAPNDIIFNVEPILGTNTWFLTGTNYIYKVTLQEKSLPASEILDG
ncbi:calcium-dependent phosphotriesterase [Glonium stellatum]|uniref:Calcium-dependent phosphotriesterase n=1 Tax=Glonium stellatum TaxID=574774 RepID=A0A8E2FEJ5_9PEZI|nr:calcium-dependent phosphotriesterase [Glonium stellatum]